MSNMKAVAGEISNVREVPQEEEQQPVVEEEEELPEVPIHYLPVIDAQYALMGDLGDLARETHCFGHLWKDPEGICPSAGECEISAHCQAVYEKVQNSDFGRLGKTPRKKRKKPAASLTGEEQYLSFMKTGDRVLDKADRTRFKWKGTSKYGRHGYVDMGRPVDQSVRRMVHELGYPPLLEKNWSRKAFAKKYSHLGRLVMGQTASYHVFMVDTQIVCRVWTAAAGHALVDLSELLVAKAKIVGEEVMPVPPRSHVKLHPCTGRMYCTDEDDAAKIANWIIDCYDLEVDPAQGAASGQHVAPAPNSKLNKKPAK